MADSTDIITGSLTDGNRAVVYDDSVAGPIASNKVVWEYLTFYNKDAADVVTVTIERSEDGGTSYQVYRKVKVQPESDAALNRPIVLKQGMDLAFTSSDAAGQINYERERRVQG